MGTIPSLSGDLRSLSPGLNGAPDLPYVTTRSFVGTYYGMRSKSCTYITLVKSGVLGLDDPHMERVMRFELTAPTLARSCSTPELHQQIIFPFAVADPHWQHRCSQRSQFNAVCERWDYSLVSTRTAPATGHPSLFFNIK